MVAEAVAKVGAEGVITVEESKRTETVLDLSRRITVAKRVGAVCSRATYDIRFEYQTNRLCDSRAICAL